MITPTNVLICGCFDILHIGHIDLLKAASEFGNVYIGLGDDVSIRDKKGSHRPILPAEERKAMLLACRYVFQVKIFHFKTNPMVGYKDLLMWSTPKLYACGPDHQQPDLFPLLDRRGIPRLYVPNKIQGTTDIETKVASSVSEDVKQNTERFYFPI